MKKSMMMVIGLAVSLILVSGCILSKDKKENKEEVTTNTETVAAPATPDTATTPAVTTPEAK